MGCLLARDLFDRRSGEVEKLLYCTLNSQSFSKVPLFFLSSPHSLQQNHTPFETVTMQSFAQETSKIRKNRRREVFRTSPSNYFCTFLAQACLRAPASLTGILDGILDGILHGLEHFTPVKVIHGLLSASYRLAQSLCQAAVSRSPPHPHHRPFGPSPGTKPQPWTTLRFQTGCVCSSGQTRAMPSEVEGSISSRGITQPTFRQLCLTKLPFEQAFSCT